MIQKPETLDTCVIPANFVDTGRCFNGNFRTRNLIEGSVLAAPIAYFISHMDIPLNQKIVFTTIFAGSVLLFFIIGINGDSVGEFIVNFFIYQKKKRVSKYNPRVKMEATPGYLTKERKELPRDKILRLLGEAKQEEDVSRDIYDPIYQEFFADDLGYVETPQDLKTRKQIRKEAKEAKRKAKLEKKIRREQAKDEKRKNRLFRRQTSKRER